MGEGGQGTSLVPDGAEPNTEGLAVGLNYGYFKGWGTTLVSKLPRRWWYTGMVPILESCVPPHHVPPQRRSRRVGDVMHSCASIWEH